MSNARKRYDIDTRRAGVVFKRPGGMLVIDALMAYREEQVFRRENGLPLRTEFEVKRGER